MAVNAKNVVSLLKSEEALQRATKDQLYDLLEHYRQMTNEMLKKAIIENDRIDLLASMVLGYTVTPMHLRMMKFQMDHPHSLQLAFRGAGKSTVCTVTKAIHMLLKDPNLRICIASKSAGNAQGFLKEIRGHFETNEKLSEIFGPYYDKRMVTKWDNSEIEVLPRIKRYKEASITCVGVEGTIVSKHYDVIISDDLVDEDNARTKYMRDKTKTWFYQTLDPCLMPPGDECPLRGQHHILGTRYHFDDLYNHLMENEFKDHYLITSALDERKRSSWPEMYPPSWFEKKKEKSGLIIFNSQYQCDTEAMKGEVFEYDDCQVIDDEEIPTQLKLYMGTDLAVTEKQKNDQFAQVVIGLDKAKNIYVMDYFTGHIGWTRQVSRFLQFYDRWEPIRAGIESNAYQDVLRQELIDRDVDLRVVPIRTDKDKMTRAWKLQPLFTSKRVFFRRNMAKLVEQFVLFPSHRLKDGVDAFDIAIRTSRKKRKGRKRREYEPGLI